MEQESALRQIQLAELQMLKETIDFFDKNDICYYAIGGTLLGAVRHKGFIPWDDDVDLGVPREDYDRLIELAKQGKCPLKITGPFNSDECYWYPLRVESRDTLVRRFVHGEEVEQYIWIDLFPLDGLPKGKMTQKLYWWNLSYKRLRFNMSRLQKFEENKSRLKSILKRVLVSFMNPSKMDKETEYLRYDRTMKKYGFRNQACFLDAEGRCEMREIAPQAWLGKGFKLPFEDIEICCIEDYDHYLTQIYGDYMKPPSDPDLYEHHINELIIKEEKS